MGFIIILFVFDSTPKMNKEECREKEMEGDKEEVGDKEDTQKENDRCSLRALCEVNDRQFEMNSPES